MTLEFINDTKLLSNNLEAWNQVDWKKVRKEVRRLRSRIFKCEKQKKNDQVVNLQKLMIKSSSNILWSIRKVCSKSGRNSPGIDGMTVTNATTKFNLFTKISSLSIQDWKPRPTRNIFIPKPDGRLRPIGIPTITDRVLQAMIVNALEPQWEARFEPTSYGFRPGKSYQDAIHRIHTLLGHKTRCWVCDVDLEGCFNNIGHDYLLTKLDSFPYVDLINKWLKAGIFLDGVYYQTDTGTPQGGVLSPLLANIAMHGLESELGIKYNNQGYITKRDNPLYRTIIRYADDLIVLCPTQEIALRTMEDLRQIFKARGLEISENKSRVVHSTDGFDFLGFNISHRVKRGCEHIAIPFPIEGYPKEYRQYISTIIIPSKKSLKKVGSSLSKAFKQYTGKPLYQLIRSTNRIIRGYCNSKRTWSVSRAFNSLTNYMYKLWVGYLKRRHPKKGFGWIRDRYVIHYQENGFNSKWVFRDPITGIISLHPNWFSEQRNWPPVEGARCPDDANSRDYWALRQQKLFVSKNVDLHTNFDRTMAARQEHICPICLDSLYEGEALHRHHIIPVSKGGKDTISNLILIHEPCHHNIHYGGNYDEWETKLTLYKESLDKTNIKNAEFISKPPIEGFGLIKS